MEYKLARNAQVEVSKTFDNDGRMTATIVVDDKWEHVFPHTSRISKHLQLMTPEDVGSRLSGGSFFMLDGNVVDFRDGSYNGHIHSDSDIDNLMHHVGAMRCDANKRDPLARVYLSNKIVNAGDTSQLYLMAGARRDFQLVVPGLSDDGYLDAALAYGWSPFQRHLNSMFIFTRLACGNDLVSNSHMINAKIPMVNRWDQHLAIAGDQLEHKVRRIVPERISALQDCSASVATLSNINRHIEERLETEQDGRTRQWLRSLSEVVDPIPNLSHHYTPVAIEDKRLSDQLPSHLSGVDVFNIVTELRSHTNPNNKSTNGALDRIGNGMLFDHGGVVSSFGTGGKIAKSSAFASADDAFYGIGIATT